MMMSTNTLIRTIALAAVAGLLLVGCGARGSSSATEGSAGEPSKQFQDLETLKGKEPIATFGKESGDAEREAASAVLAKNLTAREKANFATQCETLGKRGLESVFGKGQGTERSKCQKELKKLAEPLSGTKQLRADTLSGEIAALRIKGKQAYALYHGNDGKDYAWPMEMEGGSWRVGAIVPTELPQAKPKSKKPQSALPEEKKS
jgi:hypothetical protein